MTPTTDEDALLLDTVSQVTADLARDLLKEAGIPALQHGPDFDVAELGAAVHGVVRGVNVYVPASSLERARAVLERAWGDLPAGSGGPPPTLACPKCSGDLLPVELERIELFLCGGCQGIWLGEDELRRAKDEADPNLRWIDFEIWKHPERFRAASSDISCPTCEVPLRGLEYGETGVQVDACPTCRGVWLDAHELEHIVRSLQDELGRLPANELLAASLEEALDLIRGPESLASEWNDFTQVLRLLRLRLRLALYGLLEKLDRDRED